MTKRKEKEDFPYLKCQSKKSKQQQIVIFRPIGLSLFDISFTGIQKIIMPKYCESSFKVYQSAMLLTQMLKDHNQKPNITDYLSKQFKKLQKYIEIKAHALKKEQAQYFPCLEPIADQLLYQITPKNQNIQNKQICLINYEDGEEYYIQQFFQYSFSQIKQVQFLSTSQKKIRLERIQHSKYFKLKCSLEKDQWKAQKQVSSTKYDQICSLKEFTSKLSTDESSCDLQYFLFHLQFNNNFKKQVGFYAPKIEFKYFKYNKTTRQYFIEDQYILNWCMGMSEEPLSLLQKMCFTQTQVECLKQKYHANSKLHQNPMVYFNPMLFEEQMQRLQKIQKLKNKKILSEQNYLHLKSVKSRQEFMSFSQRLVDQLIKYQIILKGKNAKESPNFHKKTNSIQDNENKKQQTQESKQIIIEHNQAWQQFISVYNMVMTFYHLQIRSQFIISQYDGFNQKNSSQMPYDELKLKFVLQCYANPSIMWDILFDVVQQGTIKNIILNELHKKPLRISQLEQVSNYIKARTKESNQVKNYIQTSTEQKKFDPIKECCQKYCLFLRGILQSQSNMMSVVHNCTRYLVILFLTYAQALQISILITQIRSSKSQEQSNQLQKYLEQNKDIVKMQKQFLKFTKKSFKKIYQYQNDKNSPNYLILTDHAKNTVNYIKQKHSNISNINKMSNKQQRQEYEQSLQRFISFCKGFIFITRTLKYKQVQFTHKRKKTVQTRRENIQQFQDEQYLLFLAQNCQFNYFVISLLFFQSKKQYTNINYKLQQLVKLKTLQQLKSKVEYLDSYFLKLFQFKEKQNRQFICSKKTISNCILKFDMQNQKDLKSYFGIQMFLRLQYFFNIFKKNKTDLKNCQKLPQRWQRLANITPQNQMSNYDQYYLTNQLYKKNQFHNITSQHDKLEQ